MPILVKNDRHLIHITITNKPQVRAVLASS